MNREHGVYKYVYNGEVIYVGKTDAENGFSNRIQGHKKENELFNKSDIYIYKCKDKTETDSLETILINAYKPMFNKMKLYDYKIEPPELNWIPWENYRSNKKKTVSLKQALLDLKNCNVTRTLSGKQVIIGNAIPYETDDSNLAAFCDNGKIYMDCICNFPTKNSLLKMKSQIDNMLENYDYFKENFKEYQINILRKELSMQGYVLDIDTEK